jgi:isopentenyldiphosphate isomerase
MLVLRPLFFFLWNNQMPDELLDIVNDDDIVTGQEMRSIVHKRGLQHRGVHVFLVTPEGRLLVQCRGRHQESFPLALDCSVSEHVKAGERYCQAAERGMQEELGISGVYTQALVKFMMEYGSNDFEICTLYEGKVDPKFIQYNPREVEYIALYHLDELIKLIHSGEVAFTSWLIEIINWYLEKPSELNVLEIYSHDRLLPSKRSRK